METVFQRTLRLLTHLSGYFDLKGIELLMKSHSNNLKKYFDEPEHRVWTNLAMPNEIFYAMDLPAVFTENISAILAGGRRSIEPLKTANESLFTSGCCSYITCSIGVLEKGYLPPPKMFVCPSLICEDTPKVFQYLSQRYGTGYFFIDVPYSMNEEAEVYLVDQFRQLIVFLEDHTKKKFDMDRLKTAIRLSNIARSYTVKSADIRSQSIPLMYGSTGLRLLGILSKFGSEEGVDITKNIYEELERRKKTGKSPVKNRKHRILWLHLYPYYQNKLLRYLEDDLEAVIVFEENNNVYWEPLDEEKPLNALAKRLLHLPLRGSVENRVRNIYDLAKKYRVDGAIHFSHLGCKVGCGGVQFIRERLSELEIPLLELTGDNIDFRNYSQSQMETRLEAFVEMLGQS